MLNEATPISFAFVTPAKMLPCIGTKTTWESRQSANISSPPSSNSSVVEIVPIHKMSDSRVTVRFLDTLRKLTRTQCFSLQDNCVMKNMEELLYAWLPEVGKLACYVVHSDAKERSFPLVKRILQPEDEVPRLLFCQEVFLDVHKSVWSWCAVNIVVMHHHGEIEPGYIPLILFRTACYTKDLIMEQLRHLCCSSPTEAEYMKQNALLDCKVEDGVVKLLSFFETSEEGPEALLQTTLVYPALMTGDVVRVDIEYGTSQKFSYQCLIKCCRRKEGIICYDVEDVLTGMLLEGLTCVQKTTKNPMDHKSWILPVKKVPGPQKVDRSVVWNNVHMCYEQRLFGQVTCIRYNNSGTMVGCTSTNQLALLRVPQTEGAVTNEQREKKSFSFRFRDDDKMSIESLDQRVVVRSTETSFERQFLGHLRDVRDAVFLSRHNFASGSDDTTVRLWDIMNENELLVSKIHTDYVRCLENYSSGCFFSGSYDHTINLWDSRTGFEHPIQTTGQCIENPVEVMLRVHDNTLVCGAGDHITVFDVRKGLSSFILQESHHTKAVVALAFSEKHNVLLSASLDQRVKMFSMGEGVLSPVASKKFNAAVTAVDVHPKSSEFAVGTADGELRIMKLERVAEKEKHETEVEQEKRVGNDKEDNFLTVKMHQVQHQLLTYQYNRSLKTALYSRNSDVIISTVEELIRRGVLHVALCGQNDRTIVRILRFSMNFLDSPQFYESMMIILDTIFEIYGTSVGKSTFLHRELMIAHRQLSSVLSTLQRMEQTVSIMELIVNDA